MLERMLVWLMHNLFETYFPVDKSALRVSRVPTF